MNNITKIDWQLHDYCKAECSYCPPALRGGEAPRETQEYLRVLRVIVDSFTARNRLIEWKFDGGEPLDMDLVPILKYSKENGGKVTLHTNGGKLWIDWWAIEPYVDNLVLTYHYWQSPYLIRYILDTFIAKGKEFSVGVPIRPNYFDVDMSRALEIEKDYKIVVGKNILYIDAKWDAGMFEYTDEQLDLLAVKQPKIGIKHKLKHTTWAEKREELMNNKPVYFGKKCNIGIERMYIWKGGWVSGALCNNIPLGNIWKPGWTPPLSPQTCMGASCVFSEDQVITKFD